MTAMMEIRPCDFITAKNFVRENHRHNKPPVGHKFSIACYIGERLCGVAMVGRPVSRAMDDGRTLEINRCCTDGTRNACSMLYAASCRAAKAMGYKRIVTYTRESENGASLRASGFKCEGQAGGTQWTGERYAQMVMDVLREPPQELKVRWTRQL